MVDTIHRYNFTYPLPFGYFWSRVDGSFFPMKVWEVSYQLSLAYAMCTMGSPCTWGHVGMPKSFGHQPWETLLANILHVDCSLNMSPVLSLYSTFPSNIVLEYQRETAEKLSEPNFSLGFQLLVLGGLTSWLIWIFHTIPSQLTPKDDHNPLNRPARTMLEVDFQVGLRRDSWPSLPYWSCWFRPSKGDFHMDLSRKLVEMFTQNQISESCRKSIQISPWSETCSCNFKGRRFKTSLFTSSYVKLSSLNG